MARLIERSPFAGELPLTAGGVSLEEVAISSGWFIEPFDGSEAEVSSRLKAALGLALPQPNRSLSKGKARILSVGPGRSLLIDADPPDLNGLAAVSAQGDGIAALALSGTGVEAVLARLVPLDLRLAQFKKGHVARSFVNHMSATILRTGPEGFEIHVMRSMAGTLLDEVRETAEILAARP